MDQPKKRRGSSHDKKSDEVTDVIEIPSFLKLDAVGDAEVGGAVAQVITAEDEAALAEEFSAPDLAKFYLTNELEGQQNYQQSLDLFNEGTPIVQAREDILLKKAIQNVKYVNPFGLLQWKLHNALIFVARPNLSRQNFFSVPLDYLSWLVDHNVKDYDYLKQSIHEMQQAIMYIPNGKGKFFSTQMIQEVYFDGTTLHWKIPQFLCKLYAAPERYYYISMAMVAKFKSRYTGHLYELLREHMFKGQTGFLRLADFREKMMVSESEYPEFKRFSYRVLQPALAELEKEADIFATVTYRRENRSVTGLNFTIASNPKNAGADDRALVGPETFRQLREEFGLNQKQIKEITLRHSAERIEEIVDVLFYRYIFKKQKAPVRSWIGLFNNAIEDKEDRYLLTNSEKTELTRHREVKAQADRIAQVERSNAEEKQRLIEAQRSLTSQFDDYWTNLSDNERQAVWDRFVASDDAKSIRMVLRIRAGSAPNIQHPLVRPALTGYLRQIERI
ncbi:replication initiation protein [Burkholderia sp. Ac-20365]|uniref:replication initiation protein n=1 Tax=Burkholderia sp. Ac-20365 TaxID=2703897 RepID=UPI00197BDA73|nr:replication initiation protein [Burkholderia sp. Ac-20365]MBN3761049.1 replication initiation protein [Burkholderia sp. Ac-20365]